MTIILKTYAHLYSDDLDKALALLAQLTGADCDLRISLGEVEVAAIGDFLVFAGTPQALAALRAATATIIVSALDDVSAVLAAHGGQITAGSSDGPVGSFMYARHADGAQVEYLQLKPELKDRLLG
jgi:ABC-type amino acid transport substrate-binding protein